MLTLVLKNTHIDLHFHTIIMLSPKFLFTLMFVFYYHQATTGSVHPNDTKPTASIANSAVIKFPTAAVGLSYLYSPHRVNTFRL